MSPKDFTALRFVADAVVASPQKAPALLERAKGYGNISPELVKALDAISGPLTHGAPPTLAKVESVAATLACNEDPIRHFAGLALQQAAQAKSG